LVPAADARLALFLGATLALTLTPGPAVLYIVARSMDLGRRAGLLSVLGIGLGNAVHAAAAALGLAALLVSSPVLFAAVKYLGAGYLVVLGVKKLLGRGEASEAVPQAISGRAALRQAFLVALLNPKTALFFLAFLPQFADPSRGALGTQILVLGGFFVAIALVTDGGYALLAGGMGAWLRRHPAFDRIERRVSGILFIGLGVLAGLAGATGG
jgi:threonine/homoserine/homoserine lactone efflux protein